MDWRERVWGYTGAGGMVQGFAAGYFAWDLLASIEDVDVHGWGALGHAASALVVSMLGFVRLLRIKPSLSKMGKTNGNSDRLSTTMASILFSTNSQLLFSIFIGG